MRKNICAHKILCSGRGGRRAGAGQHPDHRHQGEGDGGHPHQEQAHSAQEGGVTIYISNNNYVVNQN